MGCTTHPVAFFEPPSALTIFIIVSAVTPPL
jgi:hypothetical protein